jgi:tetratricopeptide (TPR) repeat protein
MSAESVFEAARAIGDPQQRAAFLDRACPDAAVRREVEALLAAHDASNPLDRPPADLAKTGAFVPSEPAGQPGSIIAGRFKLLECIGEGGMGEVWVADQLEPIKRRVALKVIKAGMDSRSVLARFEAERQALAVMDHPNIAKVLDAGTTPEGRPYFAMELVKGTPITEFCDARKLSPRERLELFVPVCQAIQHAHTKGVIHRDIKPTNVLVALHDEKPVPKVIDFGVAKAVGQQLTEKTLYTGFGALVGTPAYMAPEQATFNQLDIDTRADVYALGVLLYELLAGSPPVEPERLKKAALDEVLRLVREEEPPRPSQRLSTSRARASIAAVRQTDPAKLSKLMRGELDWIVMKALEKDRNRRYETATGLAADVQRHLAGEPVLAHPPTLRYRVRKAFKKNRRLVVTAGLVTLALGVGSLVAAWQAFRAVAAEREAKEEQAKTAAALSRVTDEQATTQRLLASETAARREAAEALEVTTDEGIELLIAGHAALGEGEKGYLRKVLGLYEKIAADRGDTPEALELAARGQTRVAAIRVRLGELTEAATGYRAAIRRYERLAAADPSTAGYRAELARTYATLAELLIGMGNPKEAADYYRLVAATWEKLSADVPGAADYRKEAAQAYDDLAFLLKEQGRNAEADQAYARHEALKAVGTPAVDAPKLADVFADTIRKARQNVEEREALVRHSPTVPRYLRDLANSHQGLCIWLTLTKQSADAEGHYEKAAAIWEDLVARFPAFPEYRSKLAHCAEELGDLLYQRQEEADGRDHYFKAHAIFERLAAEFPAAESYPIDLAASYCNYAGKLDRAEAMVEWFTKAVAVLERVLKANPTSPSARKFLVTNLHNRGRMYAQLLRYADAIPDFDRAIEIAGLPSSDLLAQDHLTELRWSRADALARLGATDKAVREVEDLVKSLEGGGANADEATPPFFRFDLGELARRKQRGRDEQYYLGACIFAVSAAKSGDAALAVTYADRAVGLLQKSVDAGWDNLEHTKTDPDLAGLRDRADFKRLLAAITPKQPAPKTPEQELAESEERLKAVRAEKGAEHADTLDAMNNLAVQHFAAGHTETAQRLLEEALRIRRPRPDADEMGTLRTMYNLVACYRQVGDLKRAIPLAEECVRLRTKSLGPDHPETLEAMALLGASYAESDRPADALRLFETVWSRGQKCPTVSWVADALLARYVESNQLAKAEPLLRAAARRAKKKDGDQGPEYAAALAALGTNLRRQGKWGDAEPVVRECLGIRDRRAPDAWTTFESTSDLGEVLRGQGKLAEAKLLLEAGYDGLKRREAQIPAESRQAVLGEAVDRLVQVSDAARRPEASAMWRARRTIERSPPPREVKP